MLFGQGECRSLGFAAPLTTPFDEVMGLKAACTVLMAGKGSSLPICRRKCAWVERLLVPRHLFVGASDEQTWVPVRSIVGRPRYCGADSGKTALSLFSKR